MIGSTIVHLDKVDSTNNYAARELLTKSLNEGTVFTATCQQSGRGTGISQWESSVGLNLTISMVLYPRKIEVCNQFAISQAISLGLVDFLSQHVQKVSIKWPNDIYVDDRKIAGILIETVISAGKFSRAIIGIGLNINQEIFVSDAPNPVSLKNLTERNYDLEEVLDALCDKLDKRYLSLIHGDFDTLNNDYQQVLYKRGIWANFRADEIDFEGRITGVGKDGPLLIETRAGEVQGFMFKEVVFK